MPIEYDLTQLKVNNKINRLYFGELTSRRYCDSLWCFFQYDALLWCKIGVSTEMDYLNLENLKLLSSHLKIIDLRHPNEASSLGINQTNIEVLSIPYYLLKTNLSNLNKETHYALYCKDGIMSRLQARILKDKGFTKISVIRDLSEQT